jgi:hypothetical protein
MSHIRIERAAPDGPVLRVIMNSVVYDVAEGHPLAEGMVEVLTVAPHQGTPTETARLAEIRRNHLFEQQMLSVKRRDDYSTQASVDRADLLAILDKVMGIVGDWCVESNTSGGIDAGDLSWRLEEAGYPLWDGDDDE